MEGKCDVKLSRNMNCDFEIIVGEDIFHTHKDLLDKYSLYFHEKFENEYKYEPRVHLHTNKVGLDWCLEYLYSKSCPPDKHRNNQDITVLKQVIQTSKLLRIAEVQTKIQDIILKQMKDTDGLAILKFLREYGTDSYIKKAREFVKDNIHVAVAQKEFSEIDSDDFIYYIEESQASMESMWMGIDSWMRFNKERENVFYKALDIMLGTGKDITPILVDVFKSDYVQNDQQCQKRVLRELKSQEETMIAALNTNSSVQLLTAVSYACCRGELSNLKKASIQFLAENMKVSIAGYQDLALANLVEVLEATSPMVTAKQRWNVVRNWIQLESSRKQHLHIVLRAFLSSNISITSILFDLFQYPDILKQQNCKTIILYHMKRYEENMIGDLNAHSSVQLLYIFRRNDFPLGKFLKLQEAAIEVLVRNIKITTIDYRALDFEDFHKILKRAGPIITNPDKWERIAPWVRYSKSRERYMLALIKTMDSSNLASKFISKYMKLEPCIKSSKECLDYLLDVQLNNAARFGNKAKEATEAKLSSKIAIFNDGTPKLTIVDQEKKTQAAIPIPHVHSGARIASLSGDLYILSGKDLFQLKQEGLWKSVQHLKYSDSWIQLTAFEDKLAIITKNTTMIYSPTHNEVTENVGCELGDGFSSAGSHDCLFAVGGKFSGDKAKQYRSSENKWKNLPEMPMLWSYSASVYYRDKLYVMGGSWLSFRSGSVICLDGTAWIKMNSMIRSRSSFAAMVYHDKILVLGGTGELFKKTESVEQYCEGQWKEAGRTEQLHGVISLAQCQINEGEIQFRSSDYGINITSPLCRINTTHAKKMTRNPTE